MISGWGQEQEPGYLQWNQTNSSHLVYISTYPVLPVSLIDGPYLSTCIAITNRLWAVVDSPTHTSSNYYTYLIGVMECVLPGADRATHTHTVVSPDH